MNRRMVLKTLGLISLSLAALLVLPLVVSFIYGEINVADAFLKTILISVALGVVIIFLSRPDSHVIYAKESFVIVSLAWVVTSVLGALPFVFSGEIPNFIDALFETVSGFTTTGASIVADVEKMSHGILFWRSFTHWIGGMGVLVFIMAIIPVSDRSIHLMRAEMPGPIVGKLVPKAKDTAKILYLMYIVLTVWQVIMLLFGGMSLFESVVHSFGTAGTGGFGIKLDSIGGYSPYIQWVITIFMLLFGVNFNLYYLIILKKFKSAIKSTELWFYFGVVGASILVITANIYPLLNNVSDALRHSAFQVSTIITTTGYATIDFNLWPDLSKAILFILMFFGGCAGSTAGGFKISRVVILGKMIRRELKHMLHPRSVNTINFEGKPLDNSTIKGVSSYFAIYVALFAIIFLVLSIEPFGFETNFSATAACFNNVGPGFALVGPTGNYSFYSPISKLVLSIAMLLGRLEIFPLVLAFSLSTWKKQ